MAGKHTDEIVKVLQTEPMTKNRLMDVTGIQNSTITNALKRLELNGRIVKIDSKYHAKETN